MFALYLTLALLACSVSTLVIAYRLAHPGVYAGPEDIAALGGIGGLFAVAAALVAHFGGVV